MIRPWVVVALLSAAWTAGLGYYRPADWLLWAACVVLGVLSLGWSGKGTVPFALREERDSPQREKGDSPRAGLLALVLLLPAVWFMPWPYRAAPLAMVGGLALGLAPIPRQWPGRLAGAMVTAGWLLLAQAGAIVLYAAQTTRSHDLPRSLAWLVGLVARAVGADASAEGNTLALRAGAEVHRLGATWDLLVDPATLAFLVGALVMLGVIAPDQGPRRWAVWLRQARTLAILVIAWLPVRLALVLGLYLQRVMRAEASLPLGVMNQALSWWLPAVLLAGPVLLAAGFIKFPSPPTESVQPSTEKGSASRWRLLAAGALAALGAAVLSGLGAWEPIGSPKGGRVMVVERHSQWESTTRPYDEDTYYFHWTPRKPGGESTDAASEDAPGESVSYTYGLLYNYLGRFFTMSRLAESEPINAASLGRCDVLVVKTPTARFAPDEVEAIARFVRGGGGLLLIGDHTNVFNSTAYLNDLARQFGFALRDDLLFRVGTPYEQPLRPALVPHPAVEHLREMDFAVSCSIDPGRGSGRAALADAGLWSLPAQYEHENYHPPAEYRPAMRVGPFIQLWATGVGRGRVLAFTDSTIFSGFCLFQPGKAELMLGMIDWLNHTSPLDDPWTRRLVVIPLGLFGLALAGFGLWTARGSRAGVLLAACGLLGWTVACWGIGQWARAAMPPLAPERKGVDVVLDRSLSDVPLSKGAYTQGNGEGFGLLEQWIPRIGCFTSRRTGAEVFSGDALVVLCPTGSVGEDYRRRLVEYVEAGGRLLVVDSPSNARSTAGSLLGPFGLALEPGRPVRGEIVLADSTGRLPEEVSWSISGGTPLARIGPAVVAATKAWGQGRVTVIGFGSAFDDARMGGTWQQEPDAALRARYNVLFDLLRAALDRPRAKPK